MDNYKIKVKDEASSDEARDLFKKLGYHPDNSSYEPYVEWVAVFEDGSGSFYRHNMNLNECVEITIAQLRDLVVLKRNDVRDANYTYAGNPVLKLETQDYKVWDEAKQAWLEHVGSQTDLRRGLKAIPKAEKDPALISGADALRALADGKDVQVRTELTTNWDNDTATYSVEEILAEETAETDDYSSMKLFFRLKPQTIKLELEIPAPYKAKIGGREDTSFVLNVGRHQYCYNNEEDYTKARDALESVFDAAVRGTN
ncbi:hypothetical protein EA736_07965 [Acinetobacter baumannii]|uniref:hypothetical protein n=1 Tax=Acinetobacter baumannii TaxID=470 RepID=UPI0002B957BB|nr:hypothetical protein [Acinetobacter baumannii]RSP52473.1 hypothetical protein EA736_07965 [Acinetobacter baumannii]RSQ19341.1 hypothetical protein EA713_05085 [Acinetobacter baumannii]RSR90572.1 hypothetical protein EA677_18485 [Acinetobacter baumannii]